MEQLSTGEFERVRRLVPDAHEAGHMAFAHSVLDGTMPGTVLVDTASAPASAIICNESGFWHAIGRADASFATEAASALPALVRYPGTAVWASTEAWDAALGTVFGTRRHRLEFHAPATFPPRPELPSRFRLAPIDVATAAKFEGAVDPWVVSIWGGPERFVERAFGTAVLDGERLAGFCCPCAVGGAAGFVEAEVEVGTNDAYRRQGVARAASIDFFNECQRRGYVPSWTCSGDNIASHRLALALGFQFARSIGGYVVEKAMGVGGDGRWRPAIEGPD